jgi:hypothetical protein
MISLLFASIVQLVLLAHPQSNPNVADRISYQPLHDIDAYDKAGPYDVRRRSDGTTPKDQIDRGRGWLWSHWSERRLALLIVSRYSVEGERSTYYYYVEPDEDGHWRIAIKVERLEHNYRYKDPECKRYREQFATAYQLVRTELEPDQSGNYRAISSSEDRPPSTYGLSLRDRAGKEIATF